MMEDKNKVYEIQKNDICAIFDYLDNNPIMIVGIGFSIIIIGIAKIINNKGE